MPRVAKKPPVVGGSLKPSDLPPDIAPDAEPNTAADFVRTQDAGPITAGTLTTDADKVTTFTELAGVISTANVPAPPVVHERPCALDDAPIGSKIVVSKNPDGGGKVVNLTTPKDVFPLPSDDLAYTLPTGAKIRRVMPGLFQGTELNPSGNYPNLVTSTARRAIAQYREHFHKD